LERKPRSSRRLDLYFNVWASPDIEINHNS
jgi:hypothetical protein